MKMYFFFLFLFFLASCGEDTAKTSNNNFIKTLPEEQVINKMMNEFIANAETQDEIDHNLILNHIIDNQLDMQSTSDGIYYQITKEGNGMRPTIKDVIITNYHGTFLDGKIFDTTRGKKTFTHPLSRMNDGWKKILPLMKKGSTGIFIIPSRLCYGKEGFGNLIPPNTILKFEIELLGVKERRK